MLPIFLIKLKFQMCNEIKGEFNKTKTDLLLCISAEFKGKMEKIESQESNFPHKMS